jgi:hypothetical protein
VITKADIDMAKKAVLAATIDIVDGNRDGLYWLAKICAEHRIAQIERDAVIAENHAEIADGFAVYSRPEIIAKAIRDQAASPSQNGGVG